MISYLYDGTSVGLLSALAAVLQGDPAEKRWEEIRVVSQAQFQAGLFDEIHPVDADPALAERLLRALAKRLPASAFEDLLYCFFTGEPDSETAVLTYVRMLLRTGGKAAGNWADATVRRVRILSRRVGHEILRFQGFVRFRQLEDGTYYAPVEPDHAILPLLAPHFAARFADQRWLIHDLRRNTGIYYDGAKWVFLPVVEWRPGAPTSPGGLERRLTGFDATEEVYQGLWREYFQHIAIPARKNPKLQRQRLPQRYWRNMVELNRD